MILSSTLDQLENEQLVRALDDETYLFKHALTQETAYAALLKKTRRDIHAAVARTYETLYSDLLDDYAAILGRHYAETDDTAKTIEYETRAGDVAARVNASSEALEHYTHALELAKRTPSRVEPRKEGVGVNASPLQNLYLKRGRMLELSGNFDHAVENYGEMRVLAEERGDRALKLAALMARATIHSFVSDVYNADAARELSTAALEIAHAIGDRPSEAKILWNLSLLSSWTGKSRECVDYGERSLALARELNLREQLAYTLNDISFGYLGLGDATRASDALDQARVLWHELDNRTMLGDSLLRSSHINFTLARFDLVQKFSQEAHALSESIGNVWGQCESLSNLAGILTEQGEIAVALEHLARVIQLSQQSGHAAMQVIGSITLAEIHEWLGVYERGAQWVENAMRLAENRFPVWHTWAKVIRARLFFEQGDGTRGRELALEVQQSSSADDKSGMIPVLLVLAEISWIELDLAHARAFAERALEYAMETNHRAYLAQAHYQRGRALLVMNDAGAFDALVRAEGAAKTVGSKQNLWRIYATLGELEAERGNLEQADAYRHQARDALEFIVAHTPPELRATFLNLSDVRAVMDTST